MAVDCSPPAAPAPGRQRRGPRGILGVDAQGAGQDLGCRDGVHALISPGHPCCSELGAGFGSGVWMRAMFVVPHLRVLFMSPVAEAVARPLPDSPLSPLCRRSQKSPPGCTNPAGGAALLGGFSAVSGSLPPAKTTMGIFFQIFPKCRQGPEWLHFMRAGH